MNASPTPQAYNPDPHEITFFASTNYRGEARRFGIKLDDRRRHMYAIGKTGMGKSTMLENMIIQDIQNGKGLAVVDPHGDLVEKVVNYIPNERINDVIYLNPADLDFPIAFNILESVSPEYKNLISNGLVGVFKKIWADSWGPRLEYILINSILALLEYPGSTLLGVTRMLVDTRFRKKVIARVTDPVVKSFWVNEYNNYSEKFRNEAIAPIQNKVGQFLSSSLIRNIVGQPQSTIDMREIMDSGKILLLNLSKGRIGEENAALLGAMMITKLQLSAMSRVDIPEDSRRDFYLYVDEFQNFATESFAGILSEARKYRLNLILAHQYIEQLSDEVRAAVFGNVGSLIMFRVGATDAEEFEKEFQPTFMQEDCVTLPAHHVYLRLMIDGVSSEPFSATTLPPIQGATDNRDKVVGVSRERYSQNRQKVEESILKWSDYSDQDDDDEGEDTRRQGPKTQIKRQDGRDDRRAPQPKKYAEQGKPSMQSSNVPLAQAVSVPVSSLDMSNAMPNPVQPSTVPASGVHGPRIPTRPSDAPPVQTIAEQHIPLEGDQEKLQTATSIPPADTAHDELDDLKHRRLNFLEAAKDSRPQERPQETQRPQPAQQQQQLKPQQPQPQPKKQSPTASTPSHAHGSSAPAAPSHSLAESVSVSPTSINIRAIMNRGDQGRKMPATTTPSQPTVPSATTQRPVQPVAVSSVRIPQQPAAPEQSPGQGQKKRRRRRKKKSGGQGGQGSTGGQGGMGGGEHRQGGQTGNFTQSSMTNQ